MGQGLKQIRALVAAATLIAVATLPATGVANPGDLDPGFAKQGKISRGGQSAVAVAVQADGKTLILGTSTLGRLNRDGKRDPTFGKKGSTSTGIPVGYSGSGGSDVAVQPDGLSLVLGFVDKQDGTASLTVARHLTDGKLDPSFGSGGRATVPLDGTGGLDDFAPGPRIALQSDGRIVIAGTMAGTIQVARLTGAGVLDASFGGDGTVSVGLGPSGVFDDVAVGIDGKIFVAGSAAGGADTDLAVARLNADGTPDVAFSGDGVQAADLGGRETGAGVAAQPDGKVVVAGTAQVSCHGDSCEPEFALARFDSAGEPDPSFGAGGKVIAKGPDGIGSYAEALELQPDGKLVVAGGENDFLLARFNPDGSADESFGKHGLAWTPFLGSYPAYGVAMALTPDGGIVVAGYVLLEEFYDELTIARYQGGPGPADLDADGFGDAKDRCPRTFGTHRSGCPFVKRVLKLKYDSKKRLVVGRIATNQTSGEQLSGYLPGTPRICSGDAGGAVSLYERRKGPDRRMDIDRSPYELKLKPKGPGSYYARVGSKIVTAFKPDGPVELCGADRSDGVRVGA